MKLLLLILQSLFLLGILLMFDVESAEQNSMPVGVSSAQINQGKRVYKRFCSFCHGKKGEGQANWRVRQSDGKLPAPPHDESGHTWHHPDSVLFAITKYGMVPPNAPDGYKSDMPGWKDSLNDNDIWAVLAYIKSTWPGDILKQQQEINRLSIINRQ